MPFTLQPRTWYAMEYTFPSGGCHVSPVYVHEARPLHTGKGRLEVRFFHANYAQGVQDKLYTLTVLHRAAGFLAALEPHGSSGGEVAHALVVLQPISLDWLGLHFPWLAKSLREEEPLPAQLDHHLRGVQ